MQKRSGRGDCSIQKSCHSFQYGSIHSSFTPLDQSTDIEVVDPPNNGDAVPPGTLAFLTCTQIKSKVLFFFESETKRILLFAINANNRILW